MLPGSADLLQPAVTCCCRFDGLMFHASGADEDGIFTLQVLQKQFFGCDIITFSILMIYSRCQARFSDMAAAANSSSHNEENVAVAMSKVTQRSSLSCTLYLMHVQMYSTGACVDCIAFSHHTGMFGLWGSGKSRGFFRGCALTSSAAADV
jgi:hypothetical protein